MRRFQHYFLGIAVLLTVPAWAHAETTSTLRPVADGGNDSVSWSTKSGAACTGADCSAEVKETSGSSCTDSDGESSYLESSTQNAAQTFDVSLASIPDNATISRIDVSVCHTKGETGQPNKFQTRYCVDGLCSNDGQDTTPAATYQERTRSFSGLTITKTSATDLEIGIAVTGANNTRVRISQISAVLTYGTGGAGNDSKKNASQSDRRPLYSPDGRDAAPIHFTQGKTKKVTEGSAVREIQIVPPDTTTGLTSRPAEPDQLRSLRLRTNGNVYTLTDPDGDGTYTLPFSVPLGSGTYPYSLTADYGSTTRTEYGTFVVPGTVRGASVSSPRSPQILPLLNRLFRAVFGRTPSFTEWRDWAQRILRGEKRTAAELYGAMQWQRRFGNARTP